MKNCCIISTMILEYNIRLNKYSNKMSSKTAKFKG